MSRILIISDNNSAWTEKAVTHSGVLENNEVYALTIGETKNDRFYLDNGIKICRVKRHEAFNKIPKVRGLVYYADYINYIKSLQKTVGEFDVVHISYVSKEKVLAIKYLRKFAKKIVCTFWGSDLFRAGDKQLLKYKKNLESADVIMLTTSEMKRKFRSVFGGGFDNKIRIIRFGIENLDFIDPEKDSAEFKEYFSYPAQKTVVTIGYNGSPAQNHTDVIDMCAKLPDNIKSKIFLQLPLNYGLTEEYKQTLLQKLQSCGCEYGLSEPYLDGEQTGKLRQSSDIFIHAQKTDGFSASLQEYLYARKTVFNPAWLPYEELKANGAYYFEYSDYDDLYEKLKEYLQNGPDKDEKDKLAFNSKIIKELSSWGSVKDSWASLYRI
ncbi:MAG: glycosyltransferase [Clostridia bacterium]|nr:glycosyltransferase [Clostridia bacterium]